MKRIIVENVSKKFDIGTGKSRSFLEKMVITLWGEEPKKGLWALRNVSLNVNSGEIAGVIGLNGSGKSTLLRVISGIYSPDEGTVATNGHIVSLIGLGSGLKDRLTLKENIYLLCCLYGLGHNLIKKRLRVIVEFAELENFTNTKIYQLSDGMRQRLAFSIAVHCDPEILILDEVFAVGDKNFRLKSVLAMEKLVREGAAILLTSHDLDYIENQLGRNCDQVLWLGGGKTVASGKSKKILGKYRKSGKKYPKSAVRR